MDISDKENILFSVSPDLFSFSMRDLRKYSYNLIRSLCFQGHIKNSVLFGIGFSSEHESQIYLEFKDFIPPENYSYFEDPIPDLENNFSQSLFERHLYHLYPKGLIFANQPRNMSFLNYRIPSLHNIPLLIVLPESWSFLKRGLNGGENPRDTDECMQFFKNIDYFVVGSEKERNNLIKFSSVCADHVFSIPGGFAQIENQTCSPPSDFLPWNEFLSRLKISSPFFLSSACGGGEVGIQNMVRAFILLPPLLQKRFQLVIVGNRPEWMSSFKESSYEKIIFTGLLSEDELNYLYRMATLFVLPEGSYSSYPFFEALSYEIPAIAPLHSGISDFPGTGEALFEPGSPDSISRILTRLLESDTLRGRLFSHLQTSLGGMTWEKSLQKLSSSWNESLSTIKGRKENLIQSRLFRREGAKRKIACIVDTSFSTKDRMAPYRNLINELSNFHDITYMLINPIEPEEKDFSGLNRLKRKISSFDQVLYFVTDSTPMESFLDLSLNYPGVLIIIDLIFDFSPIFPDVSLDPSRTDTLVREAFISQGTIVAQKVLDPLLRTEFIKRFPLSRRILDASCEIFYFNPIIPLQIRSLYVDGTQIPLTYIPPPLVLNDDPGDFFFFDQNEKNSSKLLSVLLIVNPGLEFKWQDLLNNVLLLYSETPNIEITFLFSHMNFHQQVFEKEIEKIAESNHDLFKINFVDDFALGEVYLDKSDLVVAFGSPTSSSMWELLIKALLRMIPLAASEEFLPTGLPEGGVFFFPFGSPSHSLVDYLKPWIENPSFQKTLSYNAKEFISTNFSLINSIKSLLGGLDRIYHDWEPVSDVKLSTYMSNYLSDISIIHRSRIAEKLARCIINSESNLRKPRLYIDVTIFIREFNKNYITGIQRVVQNICRHLPRLSDSPAYTFRIGLDEGAKFFLEALLPSHDLTKIWQTGLSLSLRPGDRVLLTDTLLDIRTHEDFISFCKTRGAILQAIVYDLLPISLPDCFTLSHRENFRKWLDRTLASADLILCDSRSTAEELMSYLKESRISRQVPLKIGAFHLGSNPSSITEMSGEIPLNVKSFFSNEDEPVFLMVGTVEPRKNHIFVLDIFERIWKAGSQKKLCIVGRVGWKVRPLAHRLRTHPERGNRLLFLDGASDNVLNFCYSKATALIVASRGEGFGLPLIEGAHKGLPLLLNDLPVFREICGENAFYFSIENPASLEYFIQNWNRIRYSENAPDSRKIRKVLWEECVEELNILIHGRGNTLFEYAE